jgi:hypothetical protein
MVKAIASGDVEEAVRIAVIHIRSAGEDMLAQMRQVRTSGARGAGVSEAGVDRRVTARS